MDKNISCSFSIAHKKIWFLAKFSEFSTLFCEWNLSPNPSMLHPYQKFQRPCEKLSKFLKKKKNLMKRESTFLPGVWGQCWGPLGKIDWNFRMKILKLNREIVHKYYISMAASFASLKTVAACKGLSNYCSLLYLICWQ